MDVPVASLVASLPQLSLAGVASTATFGVALTALIKVWPQLSKLAMDARAIRRQGDREDLHNCHERLNRVEAQLGMQMMMLAAYAVVDGGLERESPAAPELYQARALLRSAWPMGVDMPDNIASILKPKVAK